MPRRNRDYAAEYAQRKQRATDRGFRSVRRERRARRDERLYREARGLPSAIPRPMARSARPDTSDMTPLEKADYYRLDEFSRSYVMRYWQDYGWFDSWAEAREWYYATA